MGLLSAEEKADRGTLDRSEGMNKGRGLEEIKDDTASSAAAVSPYNVSLDTKNKRLFESVFFGWWK